MSRLKVPFPRYLNAKKLFYRWEEDVIYVSALSGAASMVFLVWLSVNLLLALVISGFVALIVLKRYVKYFKESRKGFVGHFLYDKGFSTPIHKNKVKHDFENSLIPFGFEDEFKN